jgi:hypothetical protein
MRKVGIMTSVGALPKDLRFVSDSQDTAPIKEYIGESAQGYDAFFVSIKDGEYREVWGIVGIVPYNTKLTSRLL